MSHNHDHGASCGDESHGHDHHGHVHGIPEEQGHRDNLWARIDRDNVVALNVESGKGSDVIKTWDARRDEEVFLESDADDQMIIRVPFTGSVKLRALLLKTGPADQTPAKVALFSNVEHLDFSDIAERKPTQEFNVVQSRDLGEYHVMLVFPSIWPRVVLSFGNRPAKFPNVTSITLFFSASQGADTTKIFYVGFLGSWTERKDAPVVAVYEVKPNLADHEKIQGMDGMANASQH
ncbi:hypothetical protein EUX98_g5948 [Antrodiella citrinella]|uniref:PITH domain-containing protein n=1 Tax=Antrodiella citrinella TaxID=2447956 RepID=A0A4S4MQI8_9APHY|nr:hypothetical protein EUX98_g5948 [Antrodiella citrinella]